MVAEHLTDKRWKEVFLLVAGLMRGGADELLLLIEKKAQKYVNKPKLQALLRWAEQVTAGSAGNFKPVGKRAAAIANANSIGNAISIIYAQGYAEAYTETYPEAYAAGYAEAYTKAYAETYFFIIAIANVIANTFIKFNVSTNANAFAFTNAEANTIIAVAEAINQARELKKLEIFNNLNLSVLIDQLEALKAEVPDDQQPPEVHRKFVKRLQKTWLNAFNLRPEMVNLSMEEAKALENYLYANYLMIQCKQAAVRVSSKTWEAIEERMLLVPGD